MIVRSSTLAAPADAVWDAVLHPSTFSFVAGPLLRYPAAELAETRWVAGMELEDRLLLLGFVPLGRHHIRIESVDGDARRLQTREHGSLVRRWDHTITVDPIDERSCRYTDQLEIEAGAPTAVIAVLARVLFRYRHLRWRRLAAELSAG
jgi:hypothetical protein